MGSGGKELVFQCNSGWLAALYGRTVPHPHGNVRTGGGRGGLPIHLLKIGWVPCLDVMIDVCDRLSRMKCSVTCSGEWQLLTGPPFSNTVSHAETQRLVSPFAALSSSCYCLGSLLPLMLLFASVHIGPAGVVGLDTAYLENGYAYHTTRDTEDIITGELIS